MNINMLLKTEERAFPTQVSNSTTDTEEQEEGSIRKTKDSKETKAEKQKQSPMMQDLVWVEKLQGLLDALLEIRPKRDTMANVLVLEAMDCIVIELFDIYSRICNGIAAALVRIYTAMKTEATMALSILQKAAAQGEDLSKYIHLCRDFGVIKAKDCPKIRRIAEEDIGELEEIIKRNPDEPETEQLMTKEEDKAVILVEEDKSKKTDEPKDSTSNLETIITDEEKDSTSNLKTIIRDDWEVLDEDEEKKLNQDPDVITDEEKDSTSNLKTIIRDDWEVEKKSNQDPDVIGQVSPQRKKDGKDAPDLITF